MIGLNLRMTETTAAIACAQLSKGKKIVEGRRALAHELTDMVSDIKWIEPPVQDIDCYHVYYMWAARLWPEKRAAFVDALTAKGFPIREGYSTPLNRIFGAPRCPTAEKTEDTMIVTYEICAYDPKARHLKQMREIIKEAADKLS